MSPFTRFGRTHGLGAMSDAMLAVALAGSIFFSIDPDAARWRVALYLLLTIAPFAVVTPLLGPLVDREKGGRRGMIITSILARMLIAWQMIEHIDGLLLFPLAFGLLVMQKTYSIAKSAVVPSLVRNDIELVEANAKLAMLSAVCSMVGAGIGGIALLFSSSSPAVVAVIGYGLTMVAAVQVPKVLVADDAMYANMVAEPMADLVVPLAKNYDAVLAVANTVGKNFMPRVAAILDVSQISEISGIESPDTFIRPIYAGNAMATVQSSDAIKIITVRTTGFEKAEATGGSAAVENIAAAGDPGLSTFVGEELSKSERPELTAAKIIISGGCGMLSGDNFPIIEAVADLLGAAVGASRAAVDAGFVPNDYQVGQTGKVVAPELYIAVGISGAIQHLAGMKDSKVIVAINKDEEAPIFQVADFGLVADLFKAVPELEEELKKLPPA